MPWQIYLALVERSHRASARTVYHAMIAHLWALNRHGSDDPALAGAQERVRLAAYPPDA